MQISKDQKQLFSNFFSLSLLQIFSYILPLLTLPYLVKVLGPDIFGILVFSQALIAFFNIFVDYGFNLSATREVSIYRDNKNKLIEIFSSVMMIKVVLILIAFIFLSILIFSFNRFSNDKELYYFTFLWVIGQALFPVWYFQGIEKMKYITMINITIKILFTLAIFIFIQDQDDYLLVPVLNGISSILSGILSLWIIYKYFHQKFTLQNLSILKKYFFDSSQFFLSRLSSVGFNNINTVLIGVLLTPQMITFYYLADKIISVVLSLINPIVQTIYPYLSKRFKFSFFIKLISYVFITSLIITVFIFIVSDYISLLVLGEYNENFLNTIYILIWLIPISTIYIFIGAPLLLARGYKKEFNLSIIYGFILHFLILTVLYMYYIFNKELKFEILYLFAISLVISKLLVLFLRSYYVYKHKLYKRNL